MENIELYCQEKAAKSGSSFYYSFLFLSKRQRQAMQALYAFCREVDDIVDECRDETVAKAKLAWWQDEIDRVYQGTPLHPVGKSLKIALNHYPLQQALFEEILQGMQMDLLFQGYQTFEDLQLYCHKVASTVGLLAAEIFGYQDSNTLEYAKILGIALQLVNIIRDVGEDARRNRIYIPETELAQFSLKPEDILTCDYSENFTALMHFQSERARAYYHRAKQVLPAVDREAQRTGLVMGEIYFTLLTEIERTDFKVLQQRISLTPLRKLWIAWKTNRKLKKV
jgi:phytoene synthase